MTPDELRQAGVRVKPLEWHEAPGSFAKIQCEGVALLGGNYVARANWDGQYGKVWHVDDFGADKPFMSLDAAKAAAQADYEARILSALEPIND